MALGGAMLLGYLGFVAKSNDSTKSEDQSLLSAWPEAPAAKQSGEATERVIDCFTSCIHAFIGQNSIRFQPACKPVLRCFAYN